MRYQVAGEQPALAIPGRPVGGRPVQANPEGRSLQRGQVKPLGKRRQKQGR